MKKKGQGLQSSEELGTNESSSLLKQRKVQLKSVRICSSFSRYANTRPHQPLPTSRRDVNELVDSLLARPATPLTGPFSTRPSTIGTPARPSGSTPPASIPDTPGGRVSRLSNDGSLSRATGSTVGGASVGVPGIVDQYVEMDKSSLWDELMGKRTEKVWYRPRHSRL